MMHLFRNRDEGGMKANPAHLEGRTKLRLINQIYKTFLPYLKPYWLRILVAYTSLIGMVLMAVLEPWPLKLIFDHILWNKPLPDRIAFLTGVFGADRLALTTLFCFALLFIVLLNSVFSYAHRYLLSMTGQAVTNDIRLGIFDHLQSLSLASLVSRRTGDLVFRLTSDITSLRALLVSHLQTLGTDLLGIISTLAVMLWMDWRLTLLALAIAPPLYGISRYFSSRIEDATRRKQSKESEVASIVQETITSIAVVQAFTQEKREKKRLTKESGESLEAALETTRFSRAFSQFVKVLRTCGTALVVWYGVLRVLAGRLTPGDIIVFVAYLNNLYGPIESMSDFTADFMESLVSGERLLELVEADAVIRDAPDAVEAPPLRGQVSFQNVTFGYQPGQPVLRDLSFTAEAGQMIALVGFSGVGKSTALKLLLRFFDPWEGQIFIDGQDMRRFKVNSLRKQIGVVPQDAILFRRTIRENIGYGRPDATFDQIVAAAEAAQAHDFIMKLPVRYQTLLDERGGNLSGGQKQRITLARAFLRNAPILILDEPVAGLDSITEEQLTETLSLLMRGKTTFVIAHRLSTILRADQILLIEEGRITERGTHGELLEKSELYRRLYGLQYRRLEPARSQQSFAEGVAT